VIGGTIEPPGTYFIRTGFFLN